jgi:RHS repeat-associated protein
LGRITEVGQIKNTTSAFMTDGISRSQGTLNSWFSARSNRRGQITNTVYDIGDITLNSQLTAANLRNRVAYTTYTDSTNLLGYSQATYYSYDIHGNVDTLLQDYGNSSYVPNVMNRNANNRWKKIVYGYDLISGKVNWVAYNPKKIDEFFHRYYYDAENRLTTVETSADSLVWERDARYEYYKHGPLARSVIGQQLVQGMDYAYTLQGWLKGVNSAGGSPLGGGGDMGEDGKSNGQNKYIARDAFGYHLNYFTGDYSNINSAYTPFPDHVYKPNGTARLTSAEYRPLYNGNISSMMVNIAALNEPVLHNYRYDQLNRLAGMDTYTGFSYLNNNWGSTTLLPLRKDANGPDGAYKERIAYDANGNILKYLRKGRYGDTPMDSLTYNYTYNAQGQLQHNMLNFVRDRVNNTSPYANASRDDLEDQASGNYGYDEIGNLIKDNKESITNIKWSVYGKILEITRTATLENTTTNTSANDVVKINYSYDAAGNRISKRVQKSTGRTFYTWYARDAQGNVMATYQVDTASITVTPSTNLQNYDVHLYGSSRLGTLYRGIGATTNYTPPENLFFERGNKQYELTNHLGNVLATISDKKKGYDTTGDGQVDYCLADVRQVSDYHPFGMAMNNRTFTYNLLGYKYGFGSKEQDKESNTYDFGERIYDPRVGKFLSVDPSKKEYESPFTAFANNPVWIIDPDGADTIRISSTTTFRDQANGRNKRTIDNKTSIIKAPGDDVIYFTQTIQSFDVHGKNRWNPIIAAKQFTIGRNRITSSTDKPNADYDWDRALKPENSNWYKLGQLLGAFSPNTFEYLRTTKPSVYKNLVLSLAYGEAYNRASKWSNAGAAIFSVFIPGPKITSLGKAEEFVTIYRSISEAEAKSIMSTQQLSFGEKAMEVKQFWLERKGLENFKKTGFGNGYDLEIQVPKSLIGRGKELNTSVQVDESLGRNATVDGATQLQKINQNIKSFTIKKSN